MKHIEITLEGIIDARSVFQQKKDQHNLAVKNTPKKENLINNQIQEVIDYKTREAKNWLANEMKRFRFITASFDNNSVDTIVTTSLFLPLYDIKDPNYVRAHETVVKYKDDILKILSGYMLKLKEIMSESRDRAEELTGNWQDANELLIASGINKLFTASEQLYKKVYYISSANNQE